uniref:F-box domain-containing protein n=1 Tax=Caenorhabditis tropicalis TaxID=1561998 RepID=A0A1I7UTZ9_9PELO
MTPFPLLQLPFVAMRHVLFMMTPFGLIDLSLISSRIKRIVSNVGPRFEGNLVPGESLFITEEIGGWTYKMTSDESKDGKVTFEGFNGYQCLKYSKDPIEGWKKWYKYLKEVLRCEFYAVTFDLTRPGIRDLVDWLKGQQEVFESITIQSKEECDDDLKYVMEAFPNVLDLEILVSRYKKNFKMEIPVNLSSLTIYNAKFIDNDQFLRLNAEDIGFGEHCLTNEEINRFVRGWISMETHVGLRTLKLRMENRKRFNGMLTGIPLEQVTDVAILKKREDYLFGDMFSITRCDGKRCLVYIFSGSSLCMEVC